MLQKICALKFAYVTAAAAVATPAVGFFTVFLFPAAQSAALS